jgi:iron complex outermembrane receptor protein
MHMRIHFRRFSPAILAGFMFIAGASGALAQQPPNSITLSGNVEDSSGSALVSAHLTLLDSSGNVAAKALTDSQGHFSIPALAPGSYLLQVQSKGFQTSQRDIALSPTSPAPPIDIQMRPASIRESVTVSAEPGYAATEAQAATKVELPIMDTPVAVHVIPAQVLADQQTVNLVDALVNVSGVAPTNDAYGTSDSFSIRGFDALSVLYEDGVKIDEYSIAGLQQDLANVEQIEIVKGSASVLYGQSEPGGLVNIVTKKPRPERLFEVGQQFANHDFFRTTADFDQPLIENKLFFRFALDGTHADSFRNFIFNHQLNLYPSLTWRPNNFIDLMLQAAYQKGTNVLDNGLPFVGDGTSATAATHTWIASVPLSSNFADPGINNSPATEYRFKPVVTLHLAKDWPLRLMYRFSRTSGPTPVDEIYAGDADTNGDLPRLVFTEGYFHHRTDQAVADLPGKFTFHRLRNTFLIGFDFYKESGAYDYNTAFPQSINIYNPIFNQPYPPPDPIQEGYNTQGWTEYGAYIQDVAELPGRIFVMGGVRRNWAEQFENYFYVNGTPPYPTNVHDRPATPRAGILWRPIENLSLYTSYTSNYGASALGISNPGGGFLPPQSAEQTEFGIKTEWLNRRLTASADVYRIIKHNVPGVDPKDTALTVAIGAVRSQGVEFDVAGQVTREVRIIGGFSSIDALITNDPENLSAGLPSETGFRLPSVPHNIGSLWGVWEPQVRSLRGLRFGAGVQSRSSEQAWEYDSNPQNPTCSAFLPPCAYYLPDRIPSFVIVNMMTGLDRTVGRAHISAQVNIDNLSNRHYFANVNPNQALPGAPFTLMPRLEIRF